MNWIDILIIVVQCFVIALATTGLFAYLTLFERRLLARFQNRIGPNRAGPGGFLQPIADAVKLFFKEDIVPATADKAVYLLAPALAVIPAIIIWAVIPLGCWNIAGGYEACFNPNAGPLRNILQVADIEIGVLYLLAVTSIGVYGITLAGWASNNKYSMLGGIRSSAQLISYELALGISVLCAVMTVGSLSTREIVFAQAGFWQTLTGGTALPGQVMYWLIVPQFLAFVLFMVSSTAEVVRAPFDLVEAEQEIAGGYNVEYGSMKFALFFMSEYIKLIAVSAIAVTLFLGGWQFPGIEALGRGISQMFGETAGAVAVGLTSLGSFLLKVVGFLFLSVWIRASWPRMRYDQLMNLGWKWLLPLALINFVLTAVVIVLIPDPLVNGPVLLVGGLIALVLVASLARKPTPQVGEITMVPGGAPPSQP
jgi:NADH-quinone oxidoreductase subunit H